MKFQIVYCEGCDTTVCVPLEFIKNTAGFVDGPRYTNSVIIYSYVRTCHCDIDHGSWYRKPGNTASGSKEVVVDLDDKFEAEPDNRVERMDFVVGGEFE